MEAPHQNGEGTSAGDKQPRGILRRNQKESKKPRGIVWDEDNLIYNESQKDAKMKIDEPRTPYNRNYNPDEDEDEADDEGGDGSASEKEELPKSPRESDSFHAHFAELSSALERSKEDDDVEKRRPRFSSSDEEEGGDSEQFKKKRAAHYNEWYKLQEFRRTHSEEELDEEDNGEDNNGEATGRRAHSNGSAPNKANGMEQGH